MKNEDVMKRGEERLSKLIGLMKAFRDHENLKDWALLELVMMVVHFEATRAGASKKELDTHLRVSRRFITLLKSAEVKKERTIH